jgi:hypothetical protein
MKKTSHLTRLAIPFALSALGLTACASPRYLARTPGPTPPGEPGRRVAVVVRVQMPWYAPRFVVRGKFHDVLADYEALAHLEAKYFSITDDRRYGGLYLWSSREAAQAHFDEAWFERVRRVRGVEADVQVLDAPFVVEGSALPQGALAGERSIDFPASATQVKLTLRPGAAPIGAARDLAAAITGLDGLVRAFVTSGEGTAGVVALWATRAHAEAFAAQESRDRLVRALAATGSTVELFEAPLLLDPTLRTLRSPPTALR